MKTFRYPLGHVAIETMTAGELIKALEGYPPDMPVLATWEGQIEAVDLTNFKVEEFAWRPDERCPCLIIDVEQT